MVGAGGDSVRFLPAFATLFLQRHKRSEVACGSGQWPISADSSRSVRKDRGPCGRARRGTRGRGAGAPDKVGRLSVAFRAGRRDLPRSDVRKLPSDVGRLVEESASASQVVRPASDSRVTFSDAVDSVAVPAAYAVPIWFSERSVSSCSQAAMRATPRCCGRIDSRSPASYTTW